MSVPPSFSTCQKFRTSPTQTDSDKKALIKPDSNEKLFNLVTDVESLRSKARKIMTTDSKQNKNTHFQYRTNLLFVLLHYRALHCTALHCTALLDHSKLRHETLPGNIVTVVLHINRGLQHRQKYIYQQTVTYL